MTGVVLVCTAGSCRQVVNATKLLLYTDQQTSDTSRYTDHWRGQGGPMGTRPPNCRAKKNFIVKIERLLEPVVLNVSFRVRSNAMFTSERRY